MRLALAALALMVALPAAAAEPDLAYGAYQAGHYRRAQSEALKRLEADPKDAAAMTLLGEIYRQGLGVRIDPKAAADWYRSCSAAGTIATATDWLPRRERSAADVDFHRASDVGQPLGDLVPAVRPGTAGVQGAGRRVESRRAGRRVPVGGRAQGR